MEKTTITLAFTTSNKHNRLNETDKLQLVTKLTQALGGVTLTEHMGGYTCDDGTLAVEYSYTLDFYGVNVESCDKVAQQLASDNKQESYIINGKLKYTA